MDNKDKPVSDFEKITSSAEETNNANQVPVNQNNIETPKQEVQVNQENIEIPKKKENTNNNAIATSDKKEISKIPDNSNVKQQETKQDNMEKTNNKFINPDASKEQVSNPSVDVGKNNTNQANVIPTTNKEVNTLSQSIGTIKPDKQKSPIAMLVLFGVLIVFVLFMPQIIEFSNKYLGTNLNANNGEIINENKPQTNKPEETEEIKIYPLNSNTVIAKDTISFTNFQKSGEENKYVLNFNIKNSSSSPYSFDKKVYLDYLDSNNTLVGRSYINTLKTVASNATDPYKVDISNEIYQNATSVELVLRTDDDYPNVNISQNKLVCDKTRNNEADTLVYTFSNLRLTSIKDTKDISRGSDITDYDYNSELLKYKERISNLNALDGVSGAVTESENGFMASVSIDYQNADYEKLSTDPNYYIKETYAKVIAFEMGARDFICR